MSTENEKNAKILELEEKFKKRLWIIVTVSGLIIISLWIWNFLSPWEGVFGDKFGVVNSLFSGAAFAGIIITILLQRHELTLQRKELEETREVFQHQSELMRKQKDDATFFNLLQNHIKLIETFKESHHKNDLTHYFNKPKRQNRPIYKPDHHVHGKDAIALLQNYWKNYLYHYSESFRNKRILTLNLTDTNPLDLISSNINIFTLINATVNIREYMQQRFSDEELKFYQRTFETMCSLEEQYLFEVFTFNHPAELKGIDYQFKFYPTLNYINFHAQRLPNFKIEAIKNERDEENPFIIQIEHEGTITDADLLITSSSHTNSVWLNEAVKVNTAIQQTEKTVEISLMQTLYSSSLARIENTSEHRNDIYNSNFYMVLNILFDKEIFKVAFQININADSEILGSVLKGIKSITIEEVSVEEYDLIVCSLTAYQEDEKLDLTLLNQQEKTTYLYQKIIRKLQLQKVIDGIRSKFNVGLIEDHIIHIFQRKKDGKWGEIERIDPQILRIYITAYMKNPELFRQGLKGLKTVQKSGNLSAIWALLHLLQEEDYQN